MTLFSLLEYKTYAKYKRLTDKKTKAIADQKSQSKKQQKQKNLQRYNHTMIKKKKRQPNTKIKNRTHLL